MKREVNKIFQVAVVFIGTIVGAGLASGQEITGFFTAYGP
ncbi:MAG: transporter, partial [Clostridium sp.]